MHVDSTSAINWTKKIGKSLLQPCFKHAYVESRTLLSRSHVSSMTGGCTDPIYYQRVVSVGIGSVII